MNAPATQKKDPQAAIEYWKHEARRQRARVRELENLLAIEAAGRLRDTRILYRASQAFADASRMALSKAGAPPFEESIRLAHGGTLGEFSEWWVVTGKYVDGVG